MKRVYKNYNPYTAVTEASFTNMAMGRVLLTGEACYVLTFMWDIYSQNRLREETKKFMAGTDAGKV